MVEAMNKITHPCGHISLDCQERRFLCLVNRLFLGGVVVDWCVVRRDQWAAADVLENRTFAFLV